ncbi:MAG: tetratricopeptide repeat protein [Sulfitobacter sp.]
MFKTIPGTFRKLLGRLITLAILTSVTACSPDGFVPSGDGTFAPGVDRSKKSVDSLEVGHRLIAAGQYELAISAFNRAALDREKIDAEILSGLGAANLGLGRLGQAENALQRAVTKEDATPEMWNNLGVVLMERGKTTQAEQIFRKAYALDNGQSDAIRDNLRLTLAKRENSVIVEGQNDNYKMVRRGSSDYLVRPAS